MRAFIGMLIGMGLHEVPSLDMFWSSDPLFGVQPIVDVMPRDRFKKILQGLHLNDNSMTPARGDTNFDKLYKVRPLLDLMNTQFQNQSVTSSSMSIDEAMILFKGRSCMKRGYYSVSRKSRRWWLRIFYFILDSAIVNAYILYTSVHPEGNFKQIDFRANLFRGLVAKVRRSGPQVAFVRRRSHESIKKPPGVPDNIRTESVGIHMPAPLDKFMRCRLCSTKKNNKRSRIQCSQCRVPLCVIPMFQ